MRHATAYKRGDSFYLHSNSQTTSGVWMAARPFLKLGISVEAEELGRAARDVLDASAVGVEHPKDWNLVEYPLPEMAGVKSWPTFMKQAQCASLRVEEDGLHVYPNKNKGPKEGFEPLSNSIRVQVNASADELGRALLEAFALCQ